MSFARKMTENHKSGSCALCVGLGSSSAQGARAKQLEVSHFSLAKNTWGTSSVFFKESHIGQLPPIPNPPYHNPHDCLRHNQHDFRTKRDALICLRIGLWLFDRLLQFVWGKVHIGDGTLDSGAAFSASTPVCSSLLYQMGAEHEIRS